MMQSGFTFAFGGDDIPDSAESIPPTNTLQDQANRNRPGDNVDLHGRQARIQDLREMLESLPSQLTYGSLELVDRDGSVFWVPKRDYADVRVQMMAEDEGEYSAYLSGSDDIKENEYEGGFKTWECAVDLATVAVQMCSNDSIAKYGNIIELGCGSAIPTLVLFQHALKNIQYPSIFILADFNEEVLRLLTVPNLLLNWAKTKRNPPEFPKDLQNPNLLSQYRQKEKQPNADLTRSAGHDSYNDANEYLLSSPSGHFEITPHIITLFLSDLEKHRISINLISGSWHPADKFACLLPLSTSLSPSLSKRSSIPVGLGSKTLILSSETIYSPKSLLPITDILETTLRQHQQHQQQRHNREREETTRGEDDYTSKALVAAKRLYFGVGGGVDAFIDEVRKRGMLANERSLAEVQEKERESEFMAENGNDNSGSNNSVKNDMESDKYPSTGSVSRCIVEVRLPS